MNMAKTSVHHALGPGLHQLLESGKPTDIAAGTFIHVTIKNALAVRPVEARHWRYVLI
jgi:hypothetical protein